jgi:hypothetical protein
MFKVWSFTFPYIHTYTAGIGVLPSFFGVLNIYNPSWDRCYDFKNIFAEKMAFLTQNKASFSAKIVILTLVFEKNANFFAESG